MHKKIISGLFVTLIIATLTSCASSTPIIEPSTTETRQDQQQQQPDIKISSPTANSAISNPLIITGQAKGSWFFEGSFPIQVLDSTSKMIAQGYAQAEDEWMTENFVPFTATINFPTTGAETGFVVLSKDNPSGLPENNASITIPIKFPTIVEEATPASRESSDKSGDEYMDVKVFLGNFNFDPNVMHCEKTYPVTRSVPKTKAVARAAIESLLKGISMEEEDHGYFTRINSGVKIQSLAIQNGTAYIDFNQALQDKVGGSCLTATIRSQITETLKQFSSVKNVVISIDGNSEIILQP